MKLVYVVLLIAAVGSQTTESYRVLGLFTHPAISHFRAFQPLLHELAVHGHDVSVVSHFPDKNAPHNYHDFVLDQSQIMTAAFSVDEVSLGEIFPVKSLVMNHPKRFMTFHYFDLQYKCHDN